MGSEAWARESAAQQTDALLFTLSRAPKTIMAGKETTETTATAATEPEWDFAR